MQRTRDILACVATGIALAVLHGSLLAHAADAPPDPRQIEEMRVRAEAGERDAQAALGASYLYGFGGIARDDTLAATWIARAAEQGHPLAQFDLGELYRTGRGVAADPARAVEWFRRAAQQGNRFAQHNLGVAYCMGFGGLVASNPECSKWVRLAAAQSFRPEAVARLEAGMSPDDIAEGVRRALEWRVAPESGSAR